MTVLCAIIIPAALYTQTMFNYCSVSPFATRTVPPNIAVVLDNSSAMLSPAYPLSDRYDRPLNAYIGYFDPQGSYCVRSGLFYEIAERCDSDEKGPYPGSLLNWATMSKYDIAMLVLIGGLGFPEADALDLAGRHLEAGWTKTTPRYPNCAFVVSGDVLTITGTGCTLPDPNARIIVRKGGKSRGLIAELADKNHDGVWDALAPRFTVMGVRSSLDGSPIIYCSDSSPSLSALSDALRDAVPREADEGKPLGAAVLRVIDYFAHACAACGACADPVDSVSCRKHFAVILSDGNASDIPSPHTESHLTEAIRKAHTEDIRGDREGRQVIEFFAIDIFGSDSGRDLLKNLARYGGFTDLNGNHQPDLVAEWDRNGDSLPDTYIDVASSNGVASLLTKAFFDISARSASGTTVSLLLDERGEVGGLIQAGFDVSRDEGLREVLWTGDMRSLWMDPTSNFREDTVNDYRLHLGQDRVVKFIFDEQHGEAKAAFFSTLPDGTGGTLSSCSPSEIRTARDIGALWNAGERLAKRRPSTRTIFTAKKVIRGSRVTHEFGENPYPSFDTNMDDRLLRALNPDIPYTTDDIVRFIRGECLETGVRGDNECGAERNPRYRDRRVSLGGKDSVWKLGDIMNASPKVVGGAPLNTYHIDYADRSYYEFISDERYRKRSQVVFVGANDGMVHAFRGGYLKRKGLVGDVKAVLESFFGAGASDRDALGEELWAYVPVHALPYLKYLLQPDYCHLHYADLPLKVYDVSVDGGAGAMRSRTGWRTILLGGMRFGGACGTGGNPSVPPSGTPPDIGFSSYFGIDVTNPERPVPLWEFSDDDLGYATSLPAVVRTGDKARNGNWYVVFGSGPKTLPGGGMDVDRNIPGYLYFLNLWTGELVKKATLDHFAIVGDILAVDADGDYETERLYVGTSAKRGASWKGNILRIDVQSVLGAEGIAVPWTASYGKSIFSGDYPFTASPEAAKDIAGHTWVYAGSGKYWSDVDEMDTSRQIVLGLRDTDVSVTESALADVTHVAVSGDVTATTKSCVYEPSTGRFVSKDVVVSVEPFSPVVSHAEPGWKIFLSRGERVISRPLAVGGLLDFLTYRPDTDPCAYVGTSYLYALRYTSGLPPARPAIRSPEITSGTEGKVTVYKSIRLGYGGPPIGEGIIVQKSSDETAVKKQVALTSGVTLEAENRPLFSIVSRIIHWLRK